MPFSRRSILKSAAALGTGAVASGQTSAPAKDFLPLPQNPLGKTGAKVTRLGFGASFPEYGPRLLEFAYRLGIRYFDNSSSYLGGKAERLLGEWARQPERRRNVFVIAKSHTYEPEAIYRTACASHENMGIDTIDLYMIHALVDPKIPLDPDGAWRKVKERLQREGRIRFMGFSTHAEMPVRAACLQNAAKTGWIDSILVACDAGLIRANPEFDKALDACAKAGIGLVAMKTTRGLGKAARQPDRAKDTFAALGLSPHQAMHAAIWNDGRFAAVCSEMASRKVIEQNAAGARSFRKLDPEQVRQLETGMRELSRATCPGCDGSCRTAAGTQTDFCSIARYLAYYEEDGKRDMARELYAALPEIARSWQGADLQAASKACQGHLDFEDLLTRAARYLA